MGIHYVWDDWTFNTRLWSATITAAIKDIGIESLSELSGVSTAGLRNWARGNFTEEFKWPHMVNFFKIVNLLDISPIPFFVLEEGYDDGFQS